MGRVGESILRLGLTQLRLCFVQCRLLETRIGVIALRMCPRPRLQVLKLAASLAPLVCSDPCSTNASMRRSWKR